MSYSDLHMMRPLRPGEQPPEPSPKPGWRFSVFVVASLLASSLLLTYGFIKVTGWVPPTEEQRKAQTETKMNMAPLATWYWFHVMRR